ncbi:MAG: hypothetical protein WCM76_11040 [Bacteroidota bacterium]
MRTGKSVVAGVMMMTAMVIAAGGTLFAQASVENKEGKEANRAEEKRQKIQAMKVAYLTQSMTLTSLESEKFWPLYNEYAEKKDAENKKYREALKAYKKIGLDKLDEKQSEELVNNEMLHDQKMLDLKKEYVPKFKAMIGSKKLVQLFTAEREFQKLLLQKAKEGGKKGKGKGKDEGTDEK